MLRGGKSSQRGRRRRARRGENGDEGASPHSLWISCGTGPTPTSSSPKSSRCQRYCTRRGSLFSLGTGKSVFVRVSKSTSEGEGVGKMQDPKYQWGGKSTLIPTPLGPSFRLCSKATSLPLCAGRARTPWGHCCHLLPRGDTRENVLHVQPPPHTVLGDIPGGRGLWHRPGSATGAAGRCQKVGGSIRGPRAKRGGGRAAAGWEQNATEQEGAAAWLASWSRMMVDGKGAGQHPLSARPPAEVPARVPRCAPRAEPGTPEQQRAMEGMVAARIRPHGVR